MTAIASIIEKLRAIPRADIEHATAQARKAAHIPGWSGNLHYLFFEHCLRFLPVNPDILVCGVYHGRDLNFLSLAADHLGLPVNLTGVDLFSDQPCADWTEAQRGKSWEANGFGPPPSLQIAKHNCPGAEIVQADSFEYLVSCGRKFNLIYLDTSHDELTVREEIAAALPCLKAGGLLGGDDYNGEPHWGVKKVVDETFNSLAIFSQRIWLVQP